MTGLHFPVRAARARLARVEADGWLLRHEPLLRLGAFVGIFAAMAAWELLAPLRARAAPRGRRWLHHLGLVASYTVLVRLLFPAGAVAVAYAARERGFGLLNAVPLPSPLGVLLGVVLLDFAIWLQHVMFHAVPALWRLHRVHHADLDVDVTTGLRFHPGEIVLSMALKLAAVAVIGPPAAAVVAFEVLLNATSMFNHGNVRVPRRLERWLRWIVVTPDLHRVHHSVDERETNSNFGFNLPWWDRLLGTYKSAPASGSAAMRLGLASFPGPWRQTLWWMLCLPFAGESAAATETPRAGRDRRQDPAGSPGEGVTLQTQ